MASTTPRPRPLIPRPMIRRPTIPRLAPALAGLVAPLLATTVLAAPAAVAEHAQPHGRRIVEHRVRPGETVTGLAVRYHAWTAELLSRNHLGPDATIHAGERLEVPVVLAALPHHGEHDRHAVRHAAGHTGRTPHAARHARPADPARPAVRRTVARTAARHGVDPHLALAVAWQESGWQMDRRSGDGAIGTMQVLPATGRWMSQYAGHRLRLHRLADNATAGVRLLRVLDEQTRSRRRAVAAYYQGLGAVRRHGVYGETRHYVDNVLAIRHRLDRGRPPA